MSYEITRGCVSKAQKVVVYGPEGIGKSTFAASFPDPLFIDTEGSTGNMDVKRLPKPSSWNMLIGEIDFVITQKPCKTLVIDTIDWAEQLCVEHICAKANKTSIEDFSYGSGYIYEKEEFGRFLNRLEDVISAGINVVLTAHAQLRKFSQPNEIGEYDRWELKLGKKTGSQISPLVKEWCDTLLFANYKTFAVAIDKDGKKFKAQGGKERVMYTEHHACWDAKNRHGLAPELPFAFSSIAHIFSKAQLQNASVSQETVNSDPKYWFCPQDNSVVISQTAPDVNYIEVTKNDYDSVLEAKEKLSNSKPENTIYENVPKALSDLMSSECVTESEIRRVVSLKGYYPETTPISNYDKGFIEGVLVGAWDKVLGMIKDQRELNKIPV